MRATQEQYLALFQALLPQGEVWPRSAESTLTKMLDAFAGSVKGNHNRSVDLTDESLPTMTFEMLTDWERVCGLPIKCGHTSEQTMAQRRDAVVTQLTARGGQSRQYYIDLAKALGFDVSVYEYEPFTCESSCDDACCDDLWRFVWQINAPQTTVRDFECEFPCDEPLATWGNEPLECVITRHKPAHTNVLFSYGDA